MGTLLQGHDGPLPFPPPVRDFGLDEEVVVHVGHLFVVGRGSPTLVVHRRGNPVWFSG
jgi:hypothetical protein